MLERVEMVRRAVRDDRSTAAAALAEADPAALRELVGRLHVRPVFTAHPTQAARRTVLAKLRELARLLDGLEQAHGEKGETARLGLELPLEPPPFALGSWIGGDRDGNPTVGLADTRAVLARQHEHGARRAAALIDELSGDLSISTRIAPVTPELERLWPPTSTHCPGSTRGTGASTPGSPTG
jgi:phosphoenolpyruvate carboxylase